MFFLWLNAWSFGFAVAFPPMIAVSPTAHKLVSLVLKE
ncbi:DUF2798 domain-containing protein [Proteobacteria bacterium 005FR1]|nr:DUF2798 domain-containing protein [Proteobacteria bacterium 005FR1]